MWAWSAVSSSFSLPYASLRYSISLASRVGVCWAIAGSFPLRPIASRLLARGARSRNIEEALRLLDPPLQIGDRVDRAQVDADRRQRLRGLRRQARHDHARAEQAA